MAVQGDGQGGDVALALQILCLVDRDAGCVQNIIVVISNHIASLMSFFVLQKIITMFAKPLKSQYIHKIKE